MMAGFVGVYLLPYAGILYSNAWMCTTNLLHSSVIVFPPFSFLPQGGTRRPTLGVCDPRALSVASGQQNHRRSRLAGDHCEAHLAVCGSGRVYTLVASCRVLNFLFIRDHFPRLLFIFYAYSFSFCS
jgi:hypothetical protein